MVTNSRLDNVDQPQHQHGNRNKKSKNFNYHLTDPHDFTQCPLQIKLYEEAKHENIIICLENDITKTFVSIMLIDYFAFKTKSVNSSKENGGKKILVIESTEQTIDQRINFILNNIDLTGFVLKEDRFKALNEQQFVDEFRSSELLICESSIATQLFELNLTKIDDFCLIIFNDIHQSYDNLNNLKIMEYYERSKCKPRILSFCISLINNESTTKRMNSLISKMEKNFHSKCRASVSTYNYKPTEIIIKIKKSSLDLVLTNEFKNAFTLIGSLLNFLDKNKIKPKNDNTIDLKNTRKFLLNFVYVIEELGIWPAMKLTEIYVSELSELVAINLHEDKEYASALSALNSLFNYLRSLLTALLKNFGIHDTYLKLVSSKLRCLVSVLSENISESNRQLNLLKMAKEKNDRKRSSNKKALYDAQFSCLIFAKKKEVVRVLAAYLQQIATFDLENCFSLKTESIVCEKKIAKNFEELKPNKKQEEIIAKFKKSDYNCLVITSSNELDIPKCKLVIRFDLPSTSKEYILSKERSKPENSKLILFVNENTNEEERLLEFVKQEKILMLKFKDVLENEDEEKRLNALGINVKEIEKQIPSFRSKTTTISPETSMCFAVINRYCSKLPSDSFTKLFPRWKLNEKIDNETGLTLYQCELNLPINSSIRYEIKSDYYLTRKLAKKSAAIKTCKKLYECDELDDDFQPVCKENIKCIDNEIDLIDEQLNETNRNLAGTTKKRRYYNKKIANVLNGKSLQANEDYYCYVFTMRLTCPIPEEQNTRGRKIIDPADFDRNFGLIMRDKLPKICNFPVFTRSGEVVVDLKLLPNKINLKKDEFDRLVEFHKFTFKDVLHLEKYPMKFDYSNSNCTYLVVSISYNIKQSDDKLRLAKIDWNFIKIVEDYQEKLLNGSYLKTCDLTSKDRPKFEFKRELYEDAVIKPLYHKNDHNFYFYVAEIYNDLNPSSSFTNEFYKSFADYYKTKYNTEITNLTQPLLDVDYTSARLNLLTPRYVNRKGITLPMSTAKTKTEIRNNLEKKQLLVPEICIVHPFPASFWKKAVCLPSILYRVNSILLAEELRVEVASAVGIGKVELDANESWPALDFGWTLADVLNNCLNKKNDSDDSKVSFKEDEPKQTSCSTTKATDKVKSKGKAKDKQVDDFLFEDQDPVNNGLNDLVIDVFDPNLYKIDEDAKEYDSDDPELEEDFLKNLMSGTNNNDMFNMGTFDLNTGLNNPNIDSLFKGGEFSFGNQPNTTENNSNWDTADELDDDFMNIGTDGLMSVKETGNFNMESLSKDIAKMNDNVNLIKNFDSDENLSSNLDEIEYEEAAEFDPSFKSKTSQFFPKPLAEEEFRFDIRTNGLMIDNNIVDCNVSELTKICNSLKEEELSEDSIVKDVNLSHFKIEVFEDKMESKIQEENNEKNSSRISDIVKLFIDKFNLSTSLESSKQLPSVKAKFASNKSADKKNNECSDNQDDNENCKPGFGELIMIKPSRTDDNDKTKLEVVEFDQASVFNIKFDPLKEDEPNCLGPGPSIILQALTMSNASDGINLERLETVGDSFLKYAVTAYLYCVYDKIHEGKLSHLRSKEISNYNLFRLGKAKALAEIMIATKYEPIDNWLPPGFVIPMGLDKTLVDLSSQNNANIYDLTSLKHLKLDNITEDELRLEIEKRKDNCIISTAVNDAGSDDEANNQNYENALANLNKKHNKLRNTGQNSLIDATHIPYNLLTQQSISDKSIADSVEALIGSYLISNGTKSALLFMKWLGLRVMSDNVDKLNEDRDNPKWHWLPKVKSPLCLSENVENYANLSDMDKEVNLNVKTEKLDYFYYGSNLNRFEKEILYYEFKDKSYLVQAFTHNSYYDNKITDCYQRLEFLGDAILDFLITRYLFEDPAKHSPGTLTDLRSALVNNALFASLAVKYDFQKYIKVLSPDLMRVITNFANKVKKDESFINNANFCLFIEEGECENLEDIQVPKALGDVFESVAGAIYLDSNFSLDAVWNVYYRMMRPEIEYFSKNIPKSPVRELLELRPQNVKFSKAEQFKNLKLVEVEVFGEGKFPGFGRNKRCAKCAAAKKALRHIKDQEAKKNEKK